jgi:branched-subunit amino acid transport protein
MFNPPGILLNFTQFASGQFAGKSEFPTHHDFSSPPDLAERLHHTLIGILLLEAAFVYLLISALFQSPESDDDFRRLLARWFRFCSITILDACTIIVHKVVINEETSSPYSLRIDGYLLMCLNLTLLCILPWQREFKGLVPPRWLLPRAQRLVPRFVPWYDLFYPARRVLIYT